MKISMFQLVALALALGASAAPSNARRQECDDLDSTEPTTTSKIDNAFIAAAKSTNPAKAKTDKAKATKAGKAKASATSGSGSGSGTGSGGKAAKSSAGGSAPASAPTGTTPVKGGKGGTTVLSAPQIIAAGQSFDGGGATFDRGVSCTGQAEGGNADAVFIIEKGGSLSNVVIGPNQIEGVHCNGGCKITNVVWTAVCEDAFTIKVQAAGETTTVTGGSATGAADKVFQFNGAGTLSISGFTVSNSGKFVRNCGNCKASAERHIILDGIKATGVDMLAGINGNFGDTAKITNTALGGVKEACVVFKGVSSGSEPTKIGPETAGPNCMVS